MSVARRVVRCQGCGAVLQTDSKDKPGYIFKRVIENGIPKIPYCNACYEKHLELDGSTLDQRVDKDTLKILKDAVATDALIIWVIDLFSFNGTLNPDIVKKVKKLNVIVFGTKRDLFPSFVGDETLIRYLSERFGEVGIKPGWIKLIGKDDVFDPKDKATIKKIHELRKSHDVYMIGNFNSGKTTLINKLLIKYENKTKWPIKTEKYPGTDADVLEIPLTNSSFLYELPDLSNSTSAFSKVEKEVQRVITPRKEIDFRRHILGEGYTIILGGLCALSIIKGHHTTYRVFCSPSVEEKIISTDKAQEFFDKNISGKRNLLPVSKHFTNFTEFDVFDYDLDNDDKRHDIAISGLCWFSTRGKGQTLRVLLPKGVALKETLAKVRSS